VTATSSRVASRIARSAGVVALLITAVSAAVSGCQSQASNAGNAQRHPAKAVPRVRALSPRPAPAGWHHATLADGTGVLAYPPGMRLVASDRGAVSAARFSASGAYLLYLNATPRQGGESLRDWAEFRVEHLTDDEAASARLLAESHGVHFVGGIGTCVIDAYVTKVKSHHFTELACFVTSPTSASVIVAAAPTANWAKAAPVLKRAVAAYEIR